MKSINNVHIIFIIFVMVFIFVMNRKMKQQKENFDTNEIDTYINNYQDLKEMDKHMLYINYTDKHEFDGEFGTVDYSNIGQVTYNSNNYITVSDKTHLFIGSVILSDGETINKDNYKIEITIPTDGNNNIKITKNLKDIEVDIRNNKKDDGTENINHKGIFFKKILHIDIKEHLNNKTATLSDTPNVIVIVEILNNNNVSKTIEKINYVQVNTDDNIVEKMSELIAFNYRVLMHKFQILINYFRCRDDGVEKIGEGDENSCNLANNNFTQHDLDARLFEALKKPIDTNTAQAQGQTPELITDIIFDLLKKIDSSNTDLTVDDLGDHSNKLNEIKSFLGKL